MTCRHRCFRIPVDGQAVWAQRRDLSLSTMAVTDELLARHGDRVTVVVHTERFAATDKGKLVNNEHTLHCKRSGKTVHVPAEKSFLAALRDSGI